MTVGCKYLNPVWVQGLWARVLQSTHTSTQNSPGLRQSGLWNLPSPAQYANFQPGHDRLPYKHTQALWTATDSLSCQQDSCIGPPRHEQLVDNRITSPGAARSANTVSSPPSCCPGACHRLHSDVRGSRCAAGGVGHSLHLLLLWMGCCSFLHLLLSRCV